MSFTFNKIGGNEQRSFLDTFHSLNQQKLEDYLKVWAGQHFFFGEFFSVKTIGSIPGF